MLTPDLSTPEKREAYSRAIKAAGKKMVADIQADKAAHGGRSLTHRMTRKDTRFNNTGLNGWA